MWCTEPDMQKVIISRDVIFKDNEMPYLQQQASNGNTNLKNDDIDFKVELERHIKTEVKDNEEVDEEVHQEANLEGYMLVRDRVRRRITPPARFSDADMVYFALNVAENLEIDEPKNYKEAINFKEMDQWVLAMKEKLESLEKNGTWILVDKLKTQKPVSCKWLFKKKSKMIGKESVRFK